MKKDSQIEKHIKNLFNDILNVEVEIKWNEEIDKKSLFFHLIKKLENVNHIEDKVYQEGGISMSKVTDELWYVVETCFNLLYGEEISSLIFWYLFEKIDKEGKLNKYIDEEGKSFTFKDINTLWEYVEEINKL